MCLDDEADRLRIMIDDAIEMARLDTARIDLTLETSDLHDEAVRDVIACFTAGIDTRRIDVLSDAAPPIARFDRRLVRLGLKQLLDNALKYSPPGSPVRIRIGRSGNAVKLDITNHGISIPLNEERRIFDRFYRSTSVKQQVPGSGARPEHRPTNCACASWRSGGHQRR